MVEIVKYLSSKTINTRDLSIDQLRHKLYMGHTTGVPAVAEDVISTDIWQFLLRAKQLHRSARSISDNSMVVYHG